MVVIANELIVRLGERLAGGGGGGDVHERARVGARDGLPARDRREEAQRNETEEPC